MVYYTGIMGADVIENHKVLRKWTSFWRAKASHDPFPPKFTCVRTNDTIFSSNRTGLNSKFPWLSTSNLMGKIDDAFSGNNWHKMLMDAVNIGPNICQWTDFFCVFNRKHQLAQSGMYFNSKNFKANQHRKTHLELISCVSFVTIKITINARYQHHRNAFIAIYVYGISRTCSNKTISREKKIMHLKLTFW